jgi:LuxR family maltose regulon positive regulatory protein
VAASLAVASPEVVRPQAATPAAPPATVRRERLEDRLDVHAGRAVAVVTGPAGSGKTVLLAAWAADRGAAWLTLRPHHLDPGQLARDLTAALWPLGFELALGETAPAGVPAPIRLLAGDEPAAAADRPAIVLDDFQVLRGPALALVAGLATASADRLALVIGSRSDPDLSLARLRLEGRLGELRADDLAFTTEEAAALMERHGVVLRAGQLERLMQRTQGWAAGLRLAALALQDEPDVERFLEDFAGDDHTVADYLSREVLAQHPPRIRDFLLRTSIADPLCGELADALTGGSGGARTLKALHEAGVLLQSLDRHNHWFRYHPLFAELLRARLALERPGLVCELHARAARWLVGAERGTEALSHAVAAGASPEMADLLAGQWLDLLLSAQPSEAVLSAAGLRPADGRLAVVAAASALETGNPDQAAALLGPPGGTGDDVEALAALIRARAGRDVGAARRSSSALLRRTEGEGADARRLLAHLHLGIAEFDSGSLDAAREALEVAWALAAEERRDRVLTEILGRCAALEVLAGRLARAQSAAGAALAIATRDAAPRTAGRAWAWASQATVHWLRDDSALAEAAAEEAMLAAHACADAAATQVVRLVRGQIAAAHGDERRARALRQVAIEGLPAAGPVVAAWMDALGPCLWAPAVSHERTDPLAAAAARLAAGDGLSALRRVEPLLDPGSDLHPTGRLYAWLIAAVARQALGSTHDAAQALEHALEMAAQEGYRRPFADGGAAVRRLLQGHAALPTAYAATVTELIDCLQPDAAPAPGLIEPLSDRERDVLRLLPTLLTNTEIAGELFVSVNTVKTHVKSIYRKLEVSSRREAVARGRQLRLI